MNFVGNHYKAGTDSLGAKAFRETATRSRAWFAGNQMNGRQPDDPWSLVAFRNFSAADLDAYKRSAAIDMPPVTTDDAATAFRGVLAHAGASRPARDGVDQRIVADVRNGTGRIIERQSLACDLTGFGEQFVSLGRNILNHENNGEDDGIVEIAARAPFALSSGSDR